jgi:hypothetical protein
MGQSNTTQKGAVPWGKLCRFQACMGWGFQGGSKTAAALIYIVLGLLFEFQSIEYLKNYILVGLL